MYILFGGGGDSVTNEGSQSSLDTVIFAGCLLSRQKPGMTGPQAGRVVTFSLLFEKISFNSNKKNKQRPWSKENIEC